MILFLLVWLYPFSFVTLDEPADRRGFAATSLGP